MTIPKFRYEEEHILRKDGLDTLAVLWVSAALVQMSWYHRLLRWVRRLPSLRATLIEDLSTTLNKVFVAGQHLSPRRLELNDQVHYYVYSFKDGRYWYERTCGTRRSAEEWVAKLGKNATFTINTTISEAFY